MISTINVRFGARALVLASLALSLPACATITRGTTQQFTVETTPPGARASTSNGFECVSTPCTFRMPRKDPFRVTVALDGYASQTVEVTSGVSGAGGTAMAGNILVGGLIGGAVDATSGAMNDLKPNPLVVVLQPTAQASTAQNTVSATAAASSARTNP